MECCLVFSAQPTKPPQYDDLSDHYAIPHVGHGAREGVEHGFYPSISGMNVGLSLMIRGVVIKVVKATVYDQIYDKTTGSSSHRR